MHNPVGPWLEAQHLYIDQSELRKHLESPIASPLVLFDVGLGAATNAVAAILAVLEPGPEKRTLHLYSFEKNLALLSFVLGKLEFFPYLARFKRALQSILIDHHWTSSCGKIVWNLREGDFLSKIATESIRPDIIYYDPYSPAVNQEMWTTGVFKRLKNILGDG